MRHRALDHDPGCRDVIARPRMIGVFFFGGLQKVAAWLLAFAILVGDPSSIEYVDTVEVNHVSGRFTQLVYRDRAGMIRDWRVLNSHDMIPNKAGLAAWNDQGVWRTIRVRQVYETWTDYDPEVLDRKMRPEETRRKLGE